jgi:hypothetical protein
MSILRTSRFQSLSGTTYSTVLQTQVVTTTTELAYTNTNGEFFFGTITPFYSNSRILMICSFAWDGDNPNGYWSIRRSTDNGVSYTAVSGQDLPTSNNGIAGFIGNDERIGTAGDTKSTTFSISDSPGVTSAIRYQLWWNHIVQNGGTMWFNRAGTRSFDAGASTMILMEIAQ